MKISLTLTGSVLITSSAIGISIGENILVSKLISGVPRYAATISPQAVIQAGALNLQTLTSSSATLYGLRKAYGLAISATMICATVTIGISVFTTLGMQPLNLKAISREREVNTQTIQPEASSDAITADGKQADDRGTSGVDVEKNSE